MFRSVGFVVVVFIARRWGRCIFSHKAKSTFSPLSSGHILDVNEDCLGNSEATDVCQVRSRNHDEPQQHDHCQGRSKHHDEPQQRDQHFANPMVFSDEHFGFDGGPVNFGFLLSTPERGELPIGHAFSACLHCDDDSPMPQMFVVVCPRCDLFVRRGDVGIYVDICAAWQDNGDFRVQVMAIFFCFWLVWS